jgi:5-methylcytosine-specific restriction endonuclease McrA
MHDRKAVTAKQLLELVERQQYRCALSDRMLTPESASLDHIVPLTRGGEHDIDNLWILEHTVNRAKGTQLVSEFLAMCEDIVNAQRVLGKETELRRGTREQSPT